MNRFNKTFSTTNGNLQFTPSIFSSTPASARRGKKSSKKKTFLRPICDICQYCQKPYRCHRSYLKHVREHKLKETASSFPNVQKIMEHLKDNIPSAMDKLSRYPVFGPQQSAYKGLVSAVSQADLSVTSELDQCFHAIYEAVTTSLNNTKFLLPSTLITVLQKNVEHLLSNVEERKRLCGLIQVCLPCDTSVVNIFICDYILSLIHEILNFVSSSLRHLRNSQSDPETEFELSTEDQETIHYICGSVVRNFYNKSVKHSAENKQWKLIGNLIRERMLEGDLVPGPPAHVKGWTATQNRGRLFFVSATLFDFFCGVTKILSKNASTKGIDYEFIMKEVCDSGLLLLWDEVVCDSLPEEIAYRVMSGMVLSFSQTFGVGNAKKIKNAAFKKAEASVPLRHRVAPR